MSENTSTDRACTWCARITTTYRIGNLDPRYGESPSMAMCAPCAWQALGESERWTVDSATGRAIYAQMHPTGYACHCHSGEVEL